MELKAKLIDKLNAVAFDVLESDMLTGKFRDDALSEALKNLAKMVQDDKTDQHKRIIAIVDVPDKRHVKAFGIDSSIFEIVDWAAAFIPNCTINDIGLYHVE